MLEGDGLKAGGTDTGTHDVFNEPVIQLQDLSSDTITMEEEEDEVFTLLGEGSQAAGCVGMCEGGAGSDAGELEHSNMQPLNTHGTQKVRSTPKGGNIPHIDISRPNVNNVIVKEVSTPQDKWGHEFYTICVLCIQILSSELLKSNFANTQTNKHTF